MIGPVDATQDEPFSAELCRHHLLLLKSLHCGRPVLHQGRRQFIKCVTANQSGCDIEMIVYLAGHTTGVDSREVEISPIEESKEDEHSMEKAT